MKSESQLNNILSVLCAQDNTLFAVNRPPEGWSCVLLKIIALSNKEKGAIIAFLY